MYSHDSPPQQPEIPRYNAPFLPGANAAPPPMSPPPIPPIPPMPVPPRQEKTTRSRPKAQPSFPIRPEVGKTKTPPTPRASQKTPLPQKRRSGLPLWVKIVLPLVAVLLLAIGSLALVSRLTSSNDNHPAWTVVQNFYIEMKQKNYRQAYHQVSKNGLRDGILTLPSSHIYSNATDFANACKAIDAQKGPITNFSITGFNATLNLLNDPVTASVTVTRGKQSYTANIGLVQEGKFWKIDYVDNL